MSNINNSPPLLITIEDKPLFSVGMAADVPRNTIFMSAINYTSISNPVNYKRLFEQ